MDLIFGEKDYSDEDKQASKEFGENNDNLQEEGYDEPSFEPECLEAREEDDIECEFENRDGSWWCITHNCHA